MNNKQMTSVHKQILIHKYFSKEMFKCFKNAFNQKQQKKQTQFPIPTHQIIKLWHLIVNQYFSTFDNKFYKQKISLPMEVTSVAF